MTTTTTRTPVLRRHRRSARGYARFNGEDIPFGPWTDPRKPEPETQAAFDAYLARWLANGRRPDETPEEVAGLTVEALAERYKTHLVELHGETKVTRSRTDYALKALCRLYGPEPLADFGPRMLKVALRAMVTNGLCRREANARLGRIKAAFKWATSEELVEPSVWHGISTVEALRPGEAGAEDHAPREAVPEDVFKKTLRFVPWPLDTVLRLMWATGARPSEILNLTPGDFDKSDPELWVAVLRRHKTAHRGKARVLVFDKAAQELLAPFMLRPADRPLFRPEEASADLARRKRRGRQTPPWPSHDPARRREKAAREPRTFCETYDAMSLGKAVSRALVAVNAQRAKVRRRKGLTLEELPKVHWTPYMIRHAAATRIALEVGGDAATLVLGHSGRAVTERYLHDTVERTKAAVRRRVTAG